MLAGFELTPTAPLDNFHQSRLSRLTTSATLMEIVQRDNADSDESRPRKAWRSISAGSVLGRACFWRKDEHGPADRVGAHGTTGAARWSAR